MDHSMYFEPEEPEVDRGYLLSIKQELFRVLRTLRQEHQQLQELHLQETNSLKAELLQKNEQIQQLKTQLAQAHSVNKFQHNETPLKVIFDATRANSQIEESGGSDFSDRILEKVRVSPLKSKTFSKGTLKLPVRNGRKDQMKIEVHKATKKNLFTGHASENKENTTVSRSSKLSESKICSFKKNKETLVVQPAESSRDGKLSSQPSPRPKLCRKPSVKSKKFHFEKRNDESFVKYNKEPGELQGGAPWWAITIQDC